MRDPWEATSFDWDEGNEAKLQHRNVLPVDVESVFFDDDDATIKPNRRRAGSATWMLEGTDYRGRRLRIGIVWEDEDEGILRAMHVIQL